MGWLYLSVPVAGFFIALYLIESVIKSFLYRIRVGTPKEETTC
jgi:TRAP-type C4-dicarboxylate transport system permease small subunit